MTNPIIRLSYKTWHRTSSTCIRGVAFKNNTQLTSQSLAAHLPSAEADSAVWRETLRNLAGFFALIQQSQDSTIAAVDIIRSIPLFYGQHEGQLFISDSAEWVREQVNDTAMDPIARDEFLLAGYVTGRDTLYPNVKQLQAGECLKAVAGEAGITVEVQQYYRFIHTEPNEYRISELIERLDSVTTKVMRRLVDYANGRQIVIPLSGGYDSRLIATMLKKLNYKNVLCFTYGVPCNIEAEYSQQVAKALGFKWAFVEYSEEIWRSEWATIEAENYKKTSANHTSLPHIQDWVAVKQLIKEQIIESDSVVVAGHGGDFVAGSHIPMMVFCQNQHEELDMLDELIKHHYSNAPSNIIRTMSRSMLTARIRNRIGMPFDQTATGYANCYELWDWQERQAKYIGNSVRVYDQFDLDWWLPLWDRDFVKFWETVPLKLRKGREWYKNWVINQYKQNCHQAGRNDLDNAGDPSIVRGLLISVAKKLPGPLVKILKYFYRKKLMNNHFLSFQGLVPKGELDNYQKKGFNIIGIYSHLYLEGRW